MSGYVRYGWMGLALVVLALVGCGGGGGGGSNGGGGTEDDPAITEAPYTAADGSDLSGVSLAADEAAPMEWVEIQGLPEGFTTEDGYILYLPEGISGDPWSSDDALLMPVYVESEAIGDRIYLAAPLFDVEGAATRMVVTDGRSHSAILELDLLELPPRRSGAVDELIAAIDDLLKAGTEALGKDYPGEWEYWRDNRYNQLPTHLAPFALAWAEVMDPDNPFSLVNRDVTDEERELLERVLAHRNRHGRLLVETIENLAAQTRAGDTTLDEGAATTPVMSSYSPRMTSASGFVGRDLGTGAVTRVEEGAGDVPKAFIDGQPFFRIETADTLAGLLEDYADAREVAENIESVTDLAEIGATVLTVAIPGGAGAVGVRLISKEGVRQISKQTTRRVASLVTTSVAAAVGYSATAQWFLPCCIVDLQAEIDPSDGRIAFEDEPANQIRLVSATGRSESIGVNLAQKAFDRAVGSLQGKISDAAANRYAGGIRDQLDPDELAPPLPGEEDSPVESEAIVESVIGSLGIDLSVGAELVLFWEDIDLMSTEPQRWLNHDINTFADAGSPIIAQASTGSGSYEFALRTPEAFERQSSLLSITTDTDELRAAAARDTQPINLDYIEVQFTPTRLRVEKDDVTLPFRVTVSNSRLQDDPPIDLPLVVTPEIGSVEPVGPVAGEAGVYGFNYVVPDDDFPPGQIVTVSTKAISTSGIRDPGNNPPERTGSMFITADPVRVDVIPGRVCLSGGETQAYEAVDPITGAPVDVEWTATSGSITGAGLYTAPGGSGEATVTATATEDEEVSDSARVTLGSCNCTWEASVSGAPYAADSFVGDQGGINITKNDANTAYDGIFLFDADGGSSIGVDFAIPIPVGGSGPVSLESTGLSGGIISGQLYLGVEAESEQPLPPQEIMITSRTPLSGADGTSVALSGIITGLVQGVVLGDSAEDQPPPTLRTIQFSGTFRSEATGNLGCR